MFDELLSGFLGSSHGDQAMQQLATEHGLGADDASAALAAASRGAAEALNNHAADSSSPFGSIFANLGGTNTGNALLGALGAVVQGKGLKGAIEGGIESLVAAKIAEHVANATGMDPDKARLVAATVTPFVVSYLEEHGKSIL